MTQLAADFAAKGLLNLMTSSPVATGLAHLSSVVYIYSPELRILHELICGFRSV